MTIKIGKKKYKLKYTLRVLFLFESFAGYPFKFGKLVDEYLLFYAALVANNEDFKLGFNEFIEICDVQPDLFKEFTQFLLKELELRSQILQPDDVKKKEMN